MPSEHIPHAQWRSFLGKFSFRHFGWNVILEQKSSGRDKLLSADHSFLEELTTDGAAGHQQITIVLGSPFHPFHTHVFSNPQRMRVGAGNQASLEIDSADGSTVIVRLRQPDRRG